jgi:uncharacterized membrane protein YoaK (UPF0700 family)
MPPPRNELETIDAIVEAGIWRQNWSHVAAPNRNGGQEMKLPSLPTVLSFNGGYLDTLGFLALSGLFTAHVTGNFVTLGATMAHGLGGALSKVLVLPMFCLVVFASRLVCLKLQNRNRSPSGPCWS